MRPDLDDFDDMNQEPGDAPRSRAMSWLVLGVAVTGFAALAYYAYQSGTRSVNDGDILVVNAEPGAIKETPADPGGEEFPNQDKTIYNALVPESGEQKVEKLLPETEQPVMPEPAVGDAEPAKTANTTTFVNNAIADKEDETGATPQKVTAAPVQPVGPAPVTTLTPASNVSAGNTTPVAKAGEKSGVATPAPVEAKKDAAATPTPAKPAATAAGSYKIQLGAFKSQEEAKSNWTRIKAKYPSILQGSPVILRADLPNGTFYRLRASGYATADAAKSACSKLMAAGQACFYVGR